MQAVWVMHTFHSADLYPLNKWMFVVKIRTVAIMMASRYRTSPSQGSLLYRTEQMDVGIYSARFTIPNQPIKGKPVVPDKFAMIII